MKSVPFCLIGKKAKTKIKKDSIIKNAITYSFTDLVTLFQLANKHKGISKVVNRRKKIEIPSIPNEKFKFDEDTQIKS